LIKRKTKERENDREIKREEVCGWNVPSFESTPQSHNVTFALLEPV